MNRRGTAHRTSPASFLAAALFVLTAAGALAAGAYPSPSGYVNDYVGIISSARRGSAATKIDSGFSGFWTGGWRIEKTDEGKAFS